MHYGVRRNSFGESPNLTQFLSLEVFCSTQTCEKFKPRRLKFRIHGSCCLPCSPGAIACHVETCLTLDCMSSNNYFKGLKHIQPMSTLLKGCQLICLHSSSQPFHSPSWLLFSGLSPDTQCHSVTTATRRRLQILNGAANTMRKVSQRHACPPPPQKKICESIAGLPHHSGAVLEAFKHCVMSFKTFETVMPMSLPSLVLPSCCPIMCTHNRGSLAKVHDFTLGHVESNVSFTCPFC